MNDLEFVQRCARGQPSAWHEFIKEYSRLIYSYINGILRIRGVSFSQDNVNDLFQDFFLHLRQDNFKKLRSYKGKNGCSFASWLRQVAINFTISYLRRQRQDLSIDEDVDEEKSLQDLLADSNPLIRDVLLNKEKLLQLKDCIEELERGDKYFLELYINRRVCLEDLKRLLRISRAAVDMRKHRIVERLRNCFKIKGFALDL